MTEAFKSLKSEDVGGLIDESRLAQWLDEHGLSPDEPLALRRISGGLSNESIGIERGGQRWVLRRPAVNALDGADRGMQREFRVLSALEGTPVPHPKALALCSDLDVAGCVFYVMEHVDGFPPGLDLREPLASDSAMQHQVAMSCMESLGELARLDWRARGLDGYGKPEGFHERQVSRWSRQLESYGARELPELREVGQWLEQHRPPPNAWTPAIMHGDYHLGNVLVAPEPPGRVAAILDWENATIGDPLLDLAGFLRMLESGGNGHWARRDELIACWEQHSGRTAPDLRYYTALSAFKLSVMIEGVHQRSLADPTRGTAEGIGDLVLQIMEQAREAIRD